MKTTLALAFLFVIALGGGYAWHAQNASSYTSNMPSQNSTTVIDGASASSSAQSPTVTSQSTQAQTAQTTTTSAGTYTAAQVATHSTSSDCWSSINGGVYNLTSWISQHPGGEGPILSICGKDGSAAFNGQHGNDGRAQRELATFKVGVLAS